MLQTAPFGRTGHQSTRLIFGAAALGAMSQRRADQVLETLLSWEVNHIDTAASYGDSELRLAAWMVEHRDRFFLASKTAARGYAEARESIRQSIERLGVDSLDLIQLHNLTDESGWREAMSATGALAAAREARTEGLVRFIGVTGHGTCAAAMHLRSLERFDFDSVLLPYNFTMMQSQPYADEFEQLLEVCGERGVAVQTIKAIARRRWREDDSQKRFSWYEPLKEPGALRRAIHWALARPEIFINTSSDATLLPVALQAADEFDASVAAAAFNHQLASDVEQLEIEPLFVHGISDSI
jgi:aryl-alcohol dehydrogenase-like predicted oxidoreductase